MTAVGVLLLAALLVGVTTTTSTWTSAGPCACCSDTTPCCNSRRPGLTTLHLTLTGTAGVLGGVPSGTAVTLTYDAAGPFCTTGWGSWEGTYSNGSTVYRFRVYCNPSPFDISPWKVSAEIDSGGCAAGAALAGNSTGGGVLSFLTSCHPFAGATDLYSSGGVFAGHAVVTE